MAKFTKNTQQNEKVIEKKRTKSTKTNLNMKYVPENRCTIGSVLTSDSESYTAYLLLMKGRAQY